MFAVGCVFSSAAGSTTSGVDTDGGQAAAVAAYVAGWRPGPGTPAQAGAFARAVVAVAGPGDRQRAKCLLWAASKLAAWAIPLGLDVVAEVLLHPSTIERFAAHSPGISPASRRTLRTNLRFLTHAVVPYLDPGDAPLPRERAKAPYTPAEIEGLLAWVDAQPTVGRRMHAGALVALGAGAGLIRADLRHTRGTDVFARSGGLVVTVHGPRARAVPVLARYQPRLAEAATFAGGDFLVGGYKPDRPNLTNHVVARLVGGGGLPALDTSRLRATWLAETATMIGLPAFLHAAGISCCQRLGDITATLDVGSEAQVVARLGGLADGGGPAAGDALAVGGGRS